MQQLFLGIDLGAISGKGVLVRTDDREIDRLNRQRGEQSVVWEINK